MPHKPIEPFKFWCQKVLPLVFDDALSYYEVLCKVQVILNRVIEEVNANSSCIEELQTDVQTLREYVDDRFANLNLDEETRKALHEMMLDGSLELLIAPIIAQFANPVFVDSVDDMRNTNFAYDNLQNGMVYVWSNADRTYTNTGHGFGGVVNDDSDMTDTTKYYALANDGYVYEYDYPNAEWVVTNNKYGGSANGVNEMLPIGRIYVLNGDNHIYQWNGTEYEDTGTVYAGSNNAFLWRKRLTQSDNVLSQQNDGWFNFNGNNLPLGLPESMVADDGYLYLTRDSDNNPLITLFTNNGGEWIYNGQWVNVSLNGLQNVENCGVPVKTGVYYVVNDAEAPVNSGTLFHIENNNKKAQILFGKDGKEYFREFDSTWFAWKTYLTANAMNEFENAIYAWTTGITALVAEQYRELQAKFESITTTASASLRAENWDFILANNGSRLCATITVVMTDKTLSISDIPADSKATGDKIIETRDNIIYRVNNDLNDLRNSVDKASEMFSSMKSFWEFNTESAGAQLKAQNGNNITAQNGSRINVTLQLVKTDKTLSDSSLPANAKSVGDAISGIYSVIAGVNERVRTLELSSSATTDEITNIKTKISAITAISAEAILTQDSRNISAQNGDNIARPATVIKTDSTLTNQSLPANAKSVGDAIQALIGGVTVEYSPVMNINKQAAFREILPIQANSQWRYRAFSSGIAYNGKEVHACRVSTGHTAPFDRNLYGTIMFHTIDMYNNIEEHYLDVSNIPLNGELRDPNISLTNNNTIILTCFATNYSVPGDYSSATYENFIATLDDNFQITSYRIFSNQNMLFWGNVLQTDDGRLLKTSYNIGNSATVNLWISETPFTGDVSNLSFTQSVISGLSSETTISYWKDKLIAMSRGGGFAITSDLTGQSGWASYNYGTDIHAVALTQQSNDPLIVGLGSHVVRETTTDEVSRVRRPPCFFLLDGENAQLELITPIDRHTNTEYYGDLLGGYPSIIRRNYCEISTCYFMDNPNSTYYHRMFDLRFVPDAMSLLDTYSPCVYPMN